MDLMRLMQSLEEFLYQVMTWLVFYPRTMWRAVVHPVAMLRYSDTEQSEKVDQQYTEALSPPLFLLITIVLAHLVELASHQRAPIPKTAIARELMDSEQSLLILRALLFAVYPLMFALAQLKQLEQPVTRETLRAPFFAQCYIAAPAAFLLGLTAILGRSPHQWVQVIALIGSLGCVAWYVAVETAWLRETVGLTGFKATRAALGTWFKAAIVSSLLTTMIVGFQGGSI